MRGCCILLILSLSGTWHCPCVQSLWSQWWQPSGLPCWKRPQAERIQVESHIIPGPRPRCFQAIDMCVNKYFLPGVHLTLTTEHGVMGKSKKSTSFQTPRPPGQMPFYYWGPRHIVIIYQYIAKTQHMGQFHVLFRF